MWLCLRLYRLTVAIVVAIYMVALRVGEVATFVEFATVGVEG